MLVDIKIPMFKALLDVQNDPTPEIPVDVGTIVVMTQSCDLENRKAPMVACCPVHTLEEFESFNERFKQKGEWENVRRGKIAGLHLLPGADIENNRTCLVATSFGRGWAGYMPRTPSAACNDPHVLVTWVSEVGSYRLRKRVG